MPEIYKGIVDPRLLGELPGGHVAKLELVNNNEGLTGRTIDPEGKKRTDELVSPNNPETEKDFVDEYLETIFRRFKGDRVFRVTKVNRDILGDAVNYIKPGKRVYAVPRGQLKEMEDLFDTIPALSIDTVGSSFSRMTGLDNDNLKKNDLGFSRSLAVEGKTFEIKFLAINDNTPQKEEQEIESVV